MGAGAGTWHGTLAAASLARAALLHPGRLHGAFSSRVFRGIISCLQRFGLGNLTLSKAVET